MIVRQIYSYNLAKLIELNYIIQFFDSRNLIHMTFLPMLKTLLPFAPPQLLTISP